MVMNLYKRVQIHADFFSDVQNFLLFFGGGGPRDNFIFQKGFGPLPGILLYVFNIYIIFFQEGSDYTPLDPGMQTAFFNCNSCYIMPSSLAKGFRYIMYIRFVKNVVYGLIRLKYRSLRMCTALLINI